MSLADLYARFWLWRRNRLIADIPTWRLSQELKHREKKEDGS